MRRLMMLLQQHRTFALNSEASPSILSLKILKIS